jgi:hypothetical protein
MTDPAPVSGLAVSMTARAARQFRRRGTVRAWRKSAEQLVANTRCKPVRRRNLHKIWRAIADAADPRTMESWPGIDALMAITELSERSVQNLTRLLERSGLLLCIEQGSTPAYPHSGYRRAALAAGSVNLRRTWVLVIPDEELAAGSETILHPMAVPPATSPPAPPLRTGHGEDQEVRYANSSSPPPRWPAGAPPWPLELKPQRRRGAQWQACASLRRAHGVLGRVGERRLRVILRRWFRSGWTPASILTAIECKPGRTPHPGANVADAARWVEYRLSFWLGPDGKPLPPPPVLFSGGRPPGPTGPGHARAQSEAETSRQARAAQLRTIPLREHTAAQWRPEPRPGDPSRWEAIARAQAAESRAARPLADDAGPGEPATPVTMAELVAVASRGAADEDEVGRRLRALAQVTAARSRRYVATLTQSDIVAM